MIVSWRSIRLANSSNCLGRVQPSCSLSSSLSIFISASFNMIVSVEDGLSAKEVLYMLCQSIVIVIVSFIHPWLAPKVDERIKAKMRNSTALTMTFVFAIAFTYTVNFTQSLIVSVLFFYVKAMLIKSFSCGVFRPRNS